VRKFEQPGEKGAFDRYELKLGKKTSSQTAPLVKEWADMVLFINYEIFTVKANDNEKDKKYRAEGGRRVIYTEHHPCWDAKNRHGLAPKLDLSYESIRNAVEGAAPLQNSPAPAPAPASVPVTAPAPTPAPVAATAPVQQTAPAPAPVTAPSPGQQQTAAKVDLSEFEEVIEEPPENLPQALRDLMKINGVTEADIRFAVSQRGYFPEAMPVSNYPPDFINGVLIGAWKQLHEMIVINKKVPF
jgi:pyruvate/2-oxoglutarate dehydrogenase complex dihydrolipoamide acyltransferase (E2) component